MHTACLSQVRSVYCMFVPGKKWNADYIYVVNSCSVAHKAEEEH